MESTSLAILVIDENRIRASIIEAGLRETGHGNVTVVHDITGIARTIAAINPDVIVISLENPNRDMLENMFQLSRGSGGRGSSSFWSSPRRHGQVQKKPSCSHTSGTVALAPHARRWFQCARMSCRSSRNGIGRSA